MLACATGTCRQRVVKSPRVAQTEDDGFHEIQLNGKQLVFLFMAATVVSVVIFLCGVLVGRGVPAEHGTAVAEASAGDSTEPSPPATPQPATSAGTSAATPAASDPRAAAPPPPAADELSYFDRLEKNGPAKEDLKGGAPRTAAAKPSSDNAAVEKPTSREKAAPADAPAQAKPVAANNVPATKQPSAKEVPAAKEGTKDTASKDAPAPKEARATAPPPPDAGTKASAEAGEFAVQVAALNARSEADAIARRLTAKGLRRLRRVAGQRHGDVPRARRPFQDAPRSRTGVRQAAKRRAVQTLDYSLAIASGALLALSFPNSAIPPSAGSRSRRCSSRCVSARTLRRAFALGLITGVVYFTGTLYWITRVMAMYGDLQTWVAVLVNAALVAYLALYPGAVRADRQRG